MRQKVFYITTSFILAIVGLRPVFSSSTPPAAHYKVIYSFQGGNDGEGPSDLTMDPEGNLYGTTALGGEAQGCVYFGYSWPGCGTVYELKRTADGRKEEILYRFNAKGDNVGGALPDAGVIFDKAGNIYGTTAGNPNNCEGNVFKLAPDSHGGWTETVLYTFTCSNGYNPDTDLVFDAQGNLFGTAQDEVFELMPQPSGTWRKVTLHTFRGAPDGAVLSSGVVLDSSGNIWGTTRSGGTRRCEDAPGTAGCGIVYKLTPAAGGKWNETVAYEFARGGGRAVTPSRGFRLGSAGHSFFGTSLAGGDGMGAVFELTQSQKGWEQNVLYRFIGYPDGEFPIGQLEVNSAGALFGVTYRGGKAGYGILFEVASSKRNEPREKVLHTFAGGTDGAYPYAGVISDSQGHLYGTAGGGNGTACGTYGCGTVYEVTP
jgi:hypothetical protein